MDGLNYCKKDFSSKEYFSISKLVIKTFVSVVLGIINIIVTYKFARQIKRKLNSMKNVYRTVIIGFLIEMIIGFRLVLLWRQLPLKSNDRESF